MRVLIVPGIGGSDELHWQSYWQSEFGDRADRIEPASWDAPQLEDWLDAIGRAVTSDTVIVAHSLGCLAAATWLVQRGPLGVVGAFVVAPPDPAGPEFPGGVGVDLVWEMLPVPTIVLASSDDPYDPLGLAPRLASAWGAGFEDVGRLGHINSDSGLGRWDAGREHFDAFLTTLRLDGRPARRMTARDG